MKRKNNKKGFTLVEVIVVLVILAILAAIMIPAMTGWIDKAKQKQVIVEARTLYLAAQTLASEDWGKPAPTNAVATDSVTGLARITMSGTISECTVANGSVTSFVYASGPITCTWTNGVLSVTGG